MSKYLVFSDSHGRQERMLEVVKRYEKEIDGLFFLGDSEGGEDQIRSSIQGPTYIVRGNCDWYSQAPDFQVAKVCGHSIAMAHGHRHNVNMDVGMLKYWALEKEADIVMFGHTHVPFLEQSSTLTVLNPGSISKPRQVDHIPTYAVIEFLDHGEVQVNICNAK